LRVNGLTFGSRACTVEREVEKEEQESQQRDAMGMNRDEIGDLPQPPGKLNDDDPTGNPAGQLTESRRRKKWKKWKKEGKGDDFPAFGSANLG
jgi:hypothetical protein